MALALAVLLVPALGAQTPAAVDPEPNLSELLPDEIVLSRPVRRDLLRLQEQWLQWMGAFDANEAEKGEIVVADIMGRAEQLGLRALPELASGAAARAVEAARQSDFRRAEWALDAAARFDSGHPEAAFARAEVERRQGKLLSALASELEGYWRLLGMAPGRSLEVANLWILGLAALLVAGGLYIALLMVVRGRPLLQALESFLRRTFLGVLPSPLLRGLVVLLLLWPLLLPAGPVWLLLFWSGLLIGYGAGSEKLVIVALWILVMLAPMLVESQRQRIDAALAPPVRALDSLGEGRLYGKLFADLGQLETLLGDEPAVQHLLADLYRGLGQWNDARKLYLSVLEQEPDNASALIDLGGYYFVRGDFGKARELFQHATEVDPGSVIAYFNLSQAYSGESAYLLDKSQEALEKAQSIDELAVTRLLEQTGRGRFERLATVDGGLARVPEIRRRLLELGDFRPALAGAAAGSRQFLGTVLGLLVLTLVALGFQIFRRRWDDSRSLILRPGGDSAAERLGRAFAPGLESVREEHGGRAFMALLVPILLLTLPLVERLGFPMVAGCAEHGLGLWGVAAVGLIIFFGMRILWELTRSR